MTTRDTRDEQLSDEEFERCLRNSDPIAVAELRADRLALKEHVRQLVENGQALEDRLAMEEDRRFRLEDEIKRWKRAAEENAIHGQGTYAAYRSAVERANSATERAENAERVLAETETANRGYKDAVRMFTLLKSGDPVLDIIDHLSSTLKQVAQQHHATITNSGLHRKRPWFEDCEALTCREAHEALAHVKEGEDV